MYELERNIKILMLTLLEISPDWRVRMLHVPHLRMGIHVPNQPTAKTQSSSLATSIVINNLESHIIREDSRQYYSVAIPPGTRAWYRFIMLEGVITLPAAITFMQTGALK